MKVFFDSLDNFLKSMVGNCQRSQSRVTLKRILILWRDHND